MFIFLWFSSANVLVHFLQNFAVIDVSTNLGIKVKANVIFVAQSFPVFISDSLLKSVKVKLSSPNFEFFGRFSLFVTCYYLILDFLVACAAGPRVYSSFN